MCPFPWCKQSNHCGFQATNVSSLNVELERDMQKPLSPASTRQLQHTTDSKPVPSGGHPKSKSANYRGRWGVGMLFFFPKPQARFRTVTWGTRIIFKALQKEANIWNTNIKPVNLLKNIPSYSIIFAKTCQMSSPHQSNVSVPGETEHQNYRLRP